MHYDRRIAPPVIYSTHNGAWTHRLGPISTTYTYYSMGVKYHHGTCKKVFLQSLFMWHSPRFTDSGLKCQEHMSHRVKLWEIKRWASISECNMNVPAVWHWLQDVYEVDTPILKHSIHALIMMMSWCDTAPRWRMRQRHGCCLAAYRARIIIPDTFTR